jgi:outer membrane biogenesis lipoprotein LolB
MNSSRFVRMALRLSAVAFLFAALFPAASRAQQKPRDQQESQQQNQQRDQYQTTQQQLDQKDLQSFRGKISQKFRKFFLEDPVSHNSYLLDDSYQAKRFLGRTVRVTGTLDEDKNIIHVQSIASAS